MRTDGLIFADGEMIEDLEGDAALQQVINVAHLPGIVGPSIAMPDIHWGYGFPIGGVAAFAADGDEGVISPGGVGYDINCGVRMLATVLDEATVRPRLAELMDRLFTAVPSGVGSHRADLVLDDAQLEAVLRRGAGWVVDQGWGTAEDLTHCEAGGCIEGAQPGRVSDRAKRRGRNQLGTLGSGNHFCEVQSVSEIFDDEAARALGLRPGGVAVMIHTGSRGLGHQVCDDHLDIMVAAAARYGIELPDKQLCCAPLSSPEGQAYWGAMCAAANFAFANRQLITHKVRGALDAVFGPGAGGESRLVYDVAHNIAKRERHEVDGRERELCVHRKGATRAFPPGHPELPEAYRTLGQPVLIPGDMGRYSYVLLGTDTAFKETFGSCCHGAGRRLSRRAAKRAARDRDPRAELAARGILVRAASRATVDEEIPEAYKDVREVVDVVDGAGIGRKVACLRPLGVVKG
jgi:tRNA-splicing ligase RtcB